jgi:polyferredoxin
MTKTPFFYFAMSVALLIDVALFLANAWIIQWLISLTGGHVTFGVACLVNLVVKVLWSLHTKSQK